MLIFTAAAQGGQLKLKLKLIAGYTPKLAILMLGPATGAALIMLTSGGPAAPASTRGLE